VILFGPLLAYSADPTTRKELLGQIFQPMELTSASLSPDGRYLAYGSGDGRKAASIRILDLDHSGDPILAAPLLTEPKRAQREGYESPMIAAPVFLVWVLPNRLVYANNYEVRAVDADGKNPLKLTDADRAAGSPQLHPYRMSLTALPAQPGSIVVTVHGAVTEDDNVRSLRQQRVDALTGKGERFESLSGVDRGWLDLQGRVRLLRSIKRGKTGPAYFFRLIKAGAEGSTVIWADLAELSRRSDFVADETHRYEHRALPLAFDRDPNLFYYASNMGRATYAIRVLNLQTGSDKVLVADDSGRDIVNPGDPEPESVLVFDRDGSLAGVRLPGVPERTRWLDQILDQLQKVLDDRFPGQDVRIMGWDENHRRALLHLSANQAPGRIVVYDLTEGHLAVSIPVAPRLEPAAISPVESFAFKGAEGDQVSGLLTLPNNPRAKSPPLVIFLHDIADGLARGGFNPHTQALAAMGFAVAELDYHGSAGYGVSFRNAVRSEGGELPLADIKAAVEWLVANRNCDRQSVSLVGRGYGGYLALRAIQRSPQLYQGVVAINAPADPMKWYFTSVLWGGELTRVGLDFFLTGPTGAMSVTESKDPLIKPALLIYALERTSDVTGNLSLQSNAVRLKAFLAGNTDVKLHSNSKWEWWDWDDWRAEYEDAGEFLTQHALQYGVSIGALKVLGTP
jgi:dipeptidyl aminopeptidase/acylaminoacyl peptidase